MAGRFSFERRDAVGRIRRIRRIGRIGEKETQSPYIQGFAVSTLPYFENNYFDYLSAGIGKDYVLHKTTTEEENAAIFEKWNEIGLPDVLIGEPDIETVFGTTIEDEYWTVECIEGKTIWKGEVMDGKAFIYLRDDLMDEYGYERVDLQEKYLQDYFIDYYVGRETYEYYQQLVEEKNKDKQILTDEIPESLK